MFLMLFPSSLLLEVGQQISQAITSTQASIFILGLSQQVNIDTPCFWNSTE